MARRPGALASLGLESPGAGLGCFLGDIAILQGLSLDLSPGTIIIWVLLDWVFCSGSAQAQSGTAPLLLVGTRALLMWSKGAWEHLVIASSWKLASLWSPKVLGHFPHWSARSSRHDLEYWNSVLTPACGKVLGSLLWLRAL